MVEEAADAGVLGVVVVDADDVDDRLDHVEVVEVLTAHRVVRAERRSCHRFGRQLGSECTLMMIASGRSF